MIRAVLVDYMGTLVQEESQYTRAVIGRCVRQSHGADPGQVAAWWFHTHDALLEECNRGCYRTEYEVARQTFQLAMARFSFSDDVDALCAMLTEHWMHTPAFSDARPFLQHCPVPVFVVSSNDTQYLSAGLRRLQAPIAGLISSEIARAYKPDARIFQKALAVSDCRPEETVHIGDSLRCDAQAAQAVGIRPLLLDRTRQHTDCGIETAASLLDALKRLNLDDTAR